MGVNEAVQAMAEVANGYRKELEGACGKLRRIGETLDRHAHCKIPCDVILDIREILDGDE